MSRLVMSMAVDGVDVDPLGAKEAAVMALEALGWVRVLSMEFQEPEQLGMDGVAQPRPAPLPRRAEKSKPPTGQAPARAPGGASVKPRPYVPRSIECCLNCLWYRASPGADENGKLHYGICTASGRPVDTLRDRCGRWKEAPRG